MIHPAGSQFSQPAQRTGGWSDPGLGRFRRFSGKLANLIFPALTLWLVFFPWNHVLAQTDPAQLLVTNVAQLHQVVAQHWRVRCELALTGTVCSASATRGVLVLADDTGAEMLVLDFAGQKVRAGQTVALTGNYCEALRRRTEIALRRAPLLDNDGVPAVTEKSGTVVLTAGRHPLRVEWFNASGPAVLEASVLAPGRPRGKLALESGMAYRCIQGNWPFLPDFDLYAAAKTGVATNIDIKLGTRQDNVALEFTGEFMASSHGEHTFFLKSNDGARLYVGEPLPRVQVVAEGRLPEARRRLIGQVLGEADIYQWCAAAGSVSYAVMRDGRLELELQSPTGNRLQANIADADGLAPELLLNSELTVAGVSRNVLIPGGQRIFGLLSVASAADVQLVTVAPEVWTAYPTASTADLSPLALRTNLGNIVHLQGRLQPADGSLRLNLTDGTGSLLLAHNGLAENLIGREVEAIGVCGRVGTNFILSGNCVRAKVPDAWDTALPQLTTAEQILRLKPEEARRGYPVRLRGVVTCTWPVSFHNLVLQDATRGIFLAQPTAGLAGLPQIGEYWEAEGVTAAGYFAPMIVAKKLTRLGEGRLPVPIQPTWDQLLNGSLDAQFVQIEGIITDLNLATAQPTLLTHWGKITITFNGEDPPGLEQFQNKLVRIRGCLLPVWDPTTHQLKPGEIHLGSATLNTDQALPSDPFAAPLKSIGELLRYDFQASEFLRVKIRGQIVAVRAGEYFLTSEGNGARFVPKTPVVFRPGDVVEVVGIPELGGPSPVLREASGRKTGVAPLPPPKIIAAGDFLLSENDATRVRLEGVLLNTREVRSEQMLDLQNGSRIFSARLREGAWFLSSMPPGTRLELTGVYAGQQGAQVVGKRVDAFELLLDSSRDVRVLARPPWWTLRRLMAALGVLLVILVGVMLWVFQLRRRVETQTKVIRENVEHTATLEERSRIARELHDTMEQALAGINFQLGALAGSLRGGAPESRQILDRARLMTRHAQAEARRTVRNLRMFALERNNLSGALEQLAKENANGAGTKITVSVSGPPGLLPVKIENHLLRIGQEAMTNALKHAQAHNIELELAYAADGVQLKITDDGGGFDVAQTAPTEAGHFGLLGMKERTDKLGATLKITSQPGAGTMVLVKVPLSASVAE